MSYADDDLSGRPRLSLQPRGSGVEQSQSLPAKTSRVVLRRSACGIERNLPGRSEMGEMGNSGLLVLSFNNYPAPELSVALWSLLLALYSNIDASAVERNPFGTARPREQVIAEREGKKEKEVLKEQAQKEWKPSIVLTEAQREEKKAAEAELAFAKSELTKEFDPIKSKALKEEVSTMEKKLEELLGSFEKMAIHAAQTGGVRRPYERRREEDRAPAAPVGGAYGGEGQDNYSNFGRGRERDVDRVGSYGDTWGAKGGSSGGGGSGSGGGRSQSSQCFTCGEMGHFSRECPNGGGGAGRGSHGGNFGGVTGRSGGRQCYTCGQEGHFSRECPQGGGGGGYGSRGGGYAGGNYGPTYGVYGNPAPEYEAGAYGTGNQGGGSYPAGSAYDDRFAYGGRSGGYPTGGRWEGYRS